MSADNMILEFGKHAGKSVTAVAQQAPSYINWAVANKPGFREELERHDLELANRIQHANAIYEDDMSQWGEVGGRKPNYDVIFHGLSRSAPAPAKPAVPGTCDWCGKPGSPADCLVLRKGQDIAAQVKHFCGTTCLRQYLEGLRAVALDPKKIIKAMPGPAVPAVDDPEPEFDPWS